MTIQKIQILLLSLFMFTQLSFTNGNPQKLTQGINKCDFRAEMRKLWEDHITWMRSYLHDRTTNAPSLQATTERLMKNQRDLGESVRDFFDEQSSETVTNFLLTHITIMGNLAQDLKKKDLSTFASDRQKLFQNANQLAEFLNKLNPENWPLEVVTFFLQDHLTLLLRWLESHVNADWTTSIEVYEKLHEEILQISDAYAYGIAKKFPEKFAE